MAAMLCSLNNSLTCITILLCANACNIVPPIMNRSTINLDQQLLLEQENIPASSVFTNVATTFPSSRSSGIALEIQQERTIAAGVNIENTAETSSLQIHPPPRPKRKSSSDLDSRHIYARASRNGRTRHHLALAKDFFAELDDDEHDDDSYSDHRDATATPTSTRTRTCWNHFRHHECLLLRSRSLRSG